MKHKKAKLLVLIKTTAKKGDNPSHKAIKRYRTHFPATNNGAGQDKKRAVYQDNRQHRMMEPGSWNPRQGPTNQVYSMTIWGHNGKGRVPRTLRLYYTESQMKLRRRKCELGAVGQSAGKERDLIGGGSKHLKRYGGLQSWLELTCKGMRAVQTPSSQLSEHTDNQEKL